MIEAVVTTTTELRGLRQPGELLGPLLALRAHCLECAGDTEEDVAQCPVTDCHCWPYRFADLVRARRLAEAELAQVETGSSPARYCECGAVLGWHRRKCDECRRKANRDRVNRHRDRRRAMR